MSSQLTPSPLILNTSTLESPQAVIQARNRKPCGDQEVENVSVSGTFTFTRSGRQSADVAVVVAVLIKVKLSGATT